MTPLGFLPLTQAIQRCAVAWNISEEKAWGRLRPWLHSGRVASCAIGGDGSQRQVDNEWAAKRNDSAYASGVLLYPFLYADGYASWAAFVEEQSLERLLSGDLQETQPRMENETMPVKKQGGAPETYDWEAMWVEIAWIVHHEGIPETELKLRKRVEEWFSARYDKCPVTNTLKPKTEKLWNRFVSDRH